MMHETEKSVMRDADRTRRIVFLSVVVVLASVIHFFEMFVPPLLPVPGFKWGFSNFVLLIVITSRTVREALLVAVLKGVIGTLLAGRFLSPAFFLGLFGSISSVFIMAILMKQRFGLIAVSVTGAFINNMIQLLIAALVFIGSFRLFHLAGYLVIIGSITGFVNALLCFGGILWLEKTGFQYYSHRPHRDGRN